MRAEAQLARRIAAGAGRGEDRLDDVGLDRLVDGAEQVLLAGEVVVHRAAGDPGGVDDLLAAGRGVALTGEQATSRCDQRAPGRVRVRSDVIGQVMKQPLPMCTEALRTNLQALRDYEPPLSGRQSSHLRIKTRPFKESQYRVGHLRPQILSQSFSRGQATQLFRARKSF